MIPRISNITYTIQINIYASLINIYSRPSANLRTFLNNIEKKDNKFSSFNNFIKN